jgi:ribosome-associated protein
VAKKIAKKPTATRRQPAKTVKRKKKTPAKRALSARQLAVKAALIARDNKSSDIVVLDLKGLSNTTDYFVIATGTSNRQMRTVADEVSKAAKTAGHMRFGMAGYEQARWIVLDFIDVVVHIFDQEYRDYYDLEMLWGDAKRVKLPSGRLKREA